MQGDKCTGASSTVVDAKIFCCGILLGVAALVIFCTLGTLGSLAPFEPEGPEGPRENSRVSAECAGPRVPRASVALNTRAKYTGK